MEAINFKLETHNFFNMPYMNNLVLCVSCMHLYSLFP